MNSEPQLGETQRPEDINNLMWTIVKDEKSKLYIYNISALVGTTDNQNKVIHSWGRSQEEGGCAS